jgi:hypothetical protein
MNNRGDVTLEIADRDWLRFISEIEHTRQQLECGLAADIFGGKPVRRCERADSRARNISDQWLRMLGDQLPKQSPRFADIFLLQEGP